jgi:acyl-CoA synthetase (AMP-forming)/AMP-acid ligase II
VAENPEKTAILFGERRISYGELDRMINRIAGGLLNMGYTRGDVVATWAPFGRA